MATKTDRNAERSPQTPHGTRKPTGASAPHSPAVEPDWGAKLVMSVEPYLTQILIGIVAVVAVVVVSILWSSWSASTRQAAWNDYFSALYAKSDGPAQNDPAADKLAGVAEQHPGTAPAVWAKIMIADVKLSRGGDSFVSRLDANRKEGEEFLNEAKKLYGEAYEAAKQLPEAQGDLLQQRALFGLALAEESLAGVNDKNAEQSLKNAEKHYKELETKWPLGLYTIRAKRRTKELADARTTAFYEKFRAYEPETPKGPGTPGAKPEFDVDLSPPLSSGPAGISPPGETLKLGPLGSTPESTDAPAAPTTPPAESTPPAAAPETNSATPPATPPAGETAPPASETPAATPATPPAAEAPATPPAAASETPAPAAPANP